MFLSHAEGSYNTIISTTGNQFGHVEGAQNKVTGNAAHAEGGGNKSIIINKNEFSSYNKKSDTEFNFTYGTNIEDLDKIVRVQLYYGDGAWDFEPYPVQSITKSGNTYTVTLPSDVYIKNVVETCVKIKFYYYSNLASGDYSHAEGEKTTASSTASHAEGESTTASGRASHAEGMYVDAVGDFSHVEGY